MNIKKLFISLYESRKKKEALKNEILEWTLRHYESPSPSHIKRAVILRNGSANATWVETGTFMGDTTAVLAKNSKNVFTIEPSEDLYKKACDRFNGVSHIHVIRGLSEDVFPSLLPKLSGDINFWLDGHYSGGITYQGDTDCPVRDELRVIEENLSRFKAVTVLIDDVRCFKPLDPQFSDYPDVDFLVDWACKNNLNWHIEHDIFVAKNLG
jgi:hypothetical protein